MNSRFRLCIEHPLWDRVEELVHGREHLHVNDHVMRAVAARVEKIRSNLHFGVIREGNR